MTIRDQRLYRKDYDTLEDYCRERWQFKRAHAYRFIESARVVKNLSPIGDIPKAESQARPLTKLPPEKQAEAWDKAVKSAPGGRVTAKHRPEKSLAFPSDERIIKGESAECWSTPPILTKRKRSLCGWLKTKIPILLVSFKPFLHPSFLALQDCYKPAQAGKSKEVIMGKGNRKTNLTTLFELGFTFEDLMHLKPSLLRKLAGVIGYHKEYPSFYGLECIVRVFSEIDQDPELQSTCKPLLNKLAKIIRGTLAKTYDAQMCAVRNQQRTIRVHMEETKRLIDQHIPVDVACQEDDKDEKILRHGSVIELRLDFLPQC